MVPTNNGVYWGAWRYGTRRAMMYKVYGLMLFLHAYAAYNAKGGKFNKSWRNGDSML